MSNNKYNLGILVLIFLSNTYNVDTRYDRLKETVVGSTCNIYFCDELKENKRHSSSLYTTLLLYNFIFGSLK